VAKLILDLYERLPNTKPGKNHDKLPALNAHPTGGKQ